jgi:fido (protein-threonine AMPylation protein)
LKRDATSINDLAAFNLSAAHYCIDLIGNELAARQTASMAQCLLELRDLLTTGQLEVPPNDVVEPIFAKLDNLLADQTPASPLITSGTLTHGQLLNQLSKLQFEDLLHPMKVEYIHFLHRILLMGVAEPRKSGKFRSTPVHVGHPGILFPPPSMLSGLMKEFVHAFPTILPNTVGYDPILKAASTSHRFVQIHPYFDGNGRIARLLTNLILWKRHPPIYLKADKKGRHRYMQALKRADRGNIEPYASLIAMSLIEIYQKLIAFVNGRKETTPADLRFPG